MFKTTSLKRKLTHTGRTRRRRADDTPRVRVAVCRSNCRQSQSRHSLVTVSCVEPIGARFPKRLLLCFSFLASLVLVVDDERHQNQTLRETGLLTIPKWPRSAGRLRGYWHLNRAQILAFSEFDVRLPNPLKIS